MKFTQALIFFGTVFIVYGGINFYIIRRTVSVLPENFKTYAIIALIFFAASFVVGRILENVWYTYLSDWLIWIGAFWIAIMFYSFLFILLIDLFRLVNHFIPFLPKVFIENPVKTGRIFASIVAILVVIIVAGGFINSRMIWTKTYNLNVNKKAGSLKKLNIVMASDLHLGTMYGHRFMYNVVDKINSMKPDIVLLAGDIVDEDIAPVIRENLGDKIENLKTRYGVYAITGNHEYIGGVESAVDYLAKHGINFLRDTSILINNSFYIVGREDRAIKNFAHKNRKPLEDILVNVDKALPVIMMDHQPFNLEQAEQNGIDLQISGHTHNGQLWPLNHVVDKVYELAWGYKKKSNTHYYVSCGVGGWGPPVRTGSAPEIVKIILTFDE